MPRTERGTRSGITALSGPCARLKPIWTHTQAITKWASVLPSAMPIRERPPTRPPRTSQGARLPYRLRVQSEMAPAMGWVITETRAPTVVMTARFAALSSSPSDRCTCSARRTDGTAPQTR